jgi:Histidine kinase
MVDCSIDATSNVANCGFGFTRDDWSAEVINKPFRRVDREHSHRELSVRLDERRRERERVARELHDSLLQEFVEVSLQLQAAVGQVPTNLPGKAALDNTMVRMQHGSHERESSPGRTSRGTPPEQGTISKMFDANGVDHYRDTSLARFKEKNDVDI